MAVDFESAKDGELIVRGHVSSKKVFKFDSVFHPEEDQGNSLINAVTHLASFLMCLTNYHFSPVLYLLALYKT